jgi:hypothetical protein
MGITPLLLGTLIAGTAATVGTGIYEAVAAPTPPTAPTAQQTAQQQAQASQAAAMAQADALTKRRGMASTILTSPLGTTAPASTQKSTLGA